MVAYCSRLEPTWLRRVAWSLGENCPAIGQVSPRPGCPLQLQNCGFCSARSQARLDHMKHRQTGKSREHDLRIRKASNHRASGTGINFVSLDLGPIPGAGTVAWLPAGRAFGNVTEQQQQLLTTNYKHSSLLTTQLLQSKVAERVNARRRPKLQGSSLCPRTLVPSVRGALQRKCSTGECTPSAETARQLTAAASTACTPNCPGRPGSTLHACM